MLTQHNIIFFLENQSSFILLLSLTRSRPLKLTVKIIEQWRCSGVFIVYFEHISHLVLVFLLLILSR